MRESPRQPSNLDIIDENALAWFGHRMERWEAMKDGSISLDDRKKKMIDDTDKELLALNAQSDDEMNPEQEMLIMDMDDIDSLEEDEKAVADLCDRKIEYYREARRIYLENI